MYNNFSFFFNIGPAPRVMPAAEPVVKFGAGSLAQHQHFFHHQITNRSHMFPILHGIQDESNRQEKFYQGAINK